MCPTIIKFQNENEINNKSHQLQLSIHRIFIPTTITKHLDQTPYKTNKILRHWAGHINEQKLIPENICQHIHIKPKTSVNNHQQPEANLPHLFHEHVGRPHLPTIQRIFTAFQLQPANRISIPSQPLATPYITNPRPLLIIHNPHLSIIPNPPQSLSPHDHNHHKQSISKSNPTTNDSWTNLNYYNRCQTIFST